MNMRDFVQQKEQIYVHPVAKLVINMPIHSEKTVAKWMSHISLIQTRLVRDVQIRDALCMKDD